MQCLVLRPSEPGPHICPQVRSAGGSALLTPDRSGPGGGLPAWLPCKLSGWATHPPPICLLQCPSNLLGEGRVSSHWSPSPRVMSGGPGTTRCSPAHGTALQGLGQAGVHSQTLGNHTAHPTKINAAPGEAAPGAQGRNRGPGGPMGANQHWQGQWVPGLPTGGGRRLQGGVRPRGQGKNQPFKKASRVWPLFTP